MQTPAGTSDATFARLGELQETLRGEVITPRERAYDAARRLYNAMIDKHPVAIARCSDVADVIAAVRFGRKEHMRTAIRGGGHNGPGLGSIEGGLVIDLSKMHGVDVDPASATVRVQCGSTWGDVDHATHALGLATPSGVISTTGVAGLTLGGGHGYLTRKYGLTIDNLISATVVLADGRFVTASANEHPELFWALRGGGGNFGVVTSFEFRLHPVHTVYAGSTLWPVEHTPEVLRWYDGFIRTAPRDVYGFFALLTVPPAPMFPAELHHQKACGIVWCCLNDPADAARIVGKVRVAGEPMYHQLGDVPYPALQSLFDPLYPPGLEWYWRGAFVNELPEPALETHLRFGQRFPTELCAMHLYPIDGAVHDVAEDATAFAYRDSRWSEVFVGVASDSSARAAITDWTKEYFDTLRPHLASGAYVNFMMEEGPARVRATYRGNYDRLVRVKREYDPTNFFSVNQNIDPMPPS